MRMRGGGAVETGRASIAAAGATAGEDGDALAADDADFAASTFVPPPEAWASALLVARRDRCFGCLRLRERFFERDRLGVCGVFVGLGLDAVLGG
jgi:hypothetical protein